MRVFAYCCASFEDVTRKAAGVAPLCSPPVTATSVDLHDLEECDLIYFDLHGHPLQPFWWGDGRTVALTAQQIREVNLNGAIVFALTCYLADEDSPMLDALLDAGARYVIGGDGKNWAGQRSLFGAGLLGLWFRRLLAWGIPPLKALAWAKKRVEWGMIDKASKRLAAKDTLQFRAYYREAT